MKPPPKPPISSLQNAASVIARIIVGGVLIYAGFSKLVAPVGEFAAAIDAYKILPTSSAIEFAGILPWVELYAGVFVLFGYFLKTGVRVAAVLFAMFLIVLVLSFLRGINPATCGCFGAGVKLTPAQGIAFDAVLFSLAYYLWAKPSMFLSAEAWISKGY